MNNDKKNDIENQEDDLDLDFEFELVNGTEATSTGSSSNVIKKIAGSTEFSAAPVELEDADPLFKLLATPTLPVLPKKDRARLQMQSPTRIYFYWSIKSNPQNVLNKAISGGSGSYTLVAKLKNLTNGIEKIFPVDSRGNWWFDVEPNCVYQCEIGFYAPNRPYIRIVYSNKLTTPRKTPSKRTDYTPSFAVTANDFALALDAAGYKRDAFDVALAGDDFEASRKATADTYRSLAGKPFPGVSANLESDLRFALLALAAGYTIEEIRTMIDSTLFELIKRDLEGISAARAMSVLKEYFDVIPGEVEEYEEFGNAVFGASLVNFPSRLRKKSIPKSMVPKLSELKNYIPKSS